MNSPDDSRLDGLVRRQAGDELQVIGTMAPLLAFDSDVAEIELRKGVWLRPITDDDRRLFVGDERPSFHVHRGLVMAKWALLAENVEGGPDLLEGKDREFFEAFTMALRLTTESEPGFDKIYMRIAENPSPFWQFHPYYHVPIGAEPVFVSRLGLEKAKEFTDTILRVMGQSQIALALSLRRFNYALTQEIPGDRLMDYVVSLEAALAPDGPGDIGYKLGVRAARLLGPPNDRVRTFNYVRRLYAVRSDLVHRAMHENLGKTKNIKRLAEMDSHGDNSFRGKSSLEIVLRDTRELVSRILKACLLHPKSPDMEAIVEDLDNQW